MTASPGGESDTKVHLVEPEDVPKQLIRPLSLEDYDHGFLPLLAHLTSVGDISRSMFAEQLQRAAGNQDYTVLVAQEAETRDVVGTATLLIEHKFIHACGKVGHIEDVVVASRCRGQKLGQRLIEALVAKSQQQGCYKVILDCSEENVAFYEKCGLKRKGVQMAHYMDT